MARTDQLFTDPVLQQIVGKLKSAAKPQSAPELAKATGLDEDLVYAELAILEHYGLIFGEYRETHNSPVSHIRYYRLDPLAKELVELQRPSPGHTSGPTFTP